MEPKARLADFGVRASCLALVVYVVDYAARDQSELQVKLPYLAGPLSLPASFIMGGITIHLPHCGGGVGVGGNSRSGSRR